MNSNYKSSRRYVKDKKERNFILIYGVLNMISVIKNVKYNIFLRLL